MTRPQHQSDLFDFGGVPLAPRPALELAVPESLLPYLRIGTCSWKYDSWKGLLYDEGKTYRPGDYLPDYARHQGTVEIDQWFWSLFPTGVRLPDQENVRQYADSVPDDFVFTVKVPNAIAIPHQHRYPSNDSPSLAGAQAQA